MKLLPGHVPKYMVLTRLIQIGPLWALFLQSSLSSANDTMGNCISQTDQQAQAPSHAIDREIEVDSRKYRKEYKILLLGAFSITPLLAPVLRCFFTGSSDSGKTTILKQMKLIHQDGFTREELITYRFTVYRNLVESAQAIVLAMRKKGIHCVVPENHVRYLPSLTHTRR